MGFNFGRIGRALAAVMDTDEIDVYRAVEITLPDGSASVELPEVPVFERVPCHISFGEADRAQSVAPGDDPTVIYATIHCGVGVDLANRDRVHARKLADDGTVLAAYEGVIGVPTTGQSRKSAVMTGRRIR